MAKEDQHKVIEIGTHQDIKRSGFHLMLKVVVLHLWFTGRLPSLRVVVEEIVG
jgi:hypothetical protein